MIKDDVLVEQLKNDFRKAELSRADRAMLEYAAKLTHKPWKMEESDVLKLRKAGFGDSAILDINQVTGYFAFVNRLADGLGVELEEFWEKEDSREIDATGRPIGTLGESKRSSKVGPL